MARKCCGFFKSAAPIQLKHSLYFGLGHLIF
jgi:hypothetical protein